MLLPCGNFTDRGFPIRDPAVQALERHTLNSISAMLRPAAVLRRVVNLEPPGEARCLLRFKCVVKRRQFVCVQIVHHQHNGLFGKVDIGKILQRSGEVLPGAAVGDLDMAPVIERSIDHEQVGGAVLYPEMIVEMRRSGLAGHPRSEALSPNYQRPS